VARRRPDAHAPPRRARLVRTGHVRRGGAIGTVGIVSDTLIERDEVVALVFNVREIAELLRELVLLVGGDDDGEEEEAD
jgi:hypothetical protein